MVTICRSGIIIIIVLISMLSASVCMSIPPNRVVNGSFELGKEKPKGWKFDAPESAITLSSEKAADGKHSVLLNTGQASLVIMKQTLCIKKLAGKKAVLQAKLYFKNELENGDEVYLRLRQFWKKGYLSDAARVWCIFHKNRLEIHEFKNGRSRAPRIVEDYTGKWISVRSEGKITETPGGREVYIHLRTKKEHPFSVFIDDVSFREIAPPVLEITSLKKIYFTDEEYIHFKAKVSPEKENIGDLKLQTILTRYRDDILLFRQEKFYTFSENEMEFDFPIKKLPKGNYKIEFILQGKSGNVLGVKTQGIEITSGPFED